MSGSPVEVDPIGPEGGLPTDPTGSIGRDTLEPLALDPDGPFHPPPAGAVPQTPPPSVRPGGVEVLPVTVAEEPGTDPSIGDVPIGHEFFETRTTGETLSSPRLPVCVLTTVIKFGPVAEPASDDAISAAIALPTLPDSEPGPLLHGGIGNVEGGFPGVEDPSGLQSGAGIEKAESGMITAVALGFRTVESRRRDSITSSEPRAHQ